MLNHPLSLPGNHCAAWCCLYHCGTYQRRRTEGLGNGVAMATERSTHDVKAQRGLGRGERGKGKEEKVYVRLQLLCFPVKWGPGKMERTEVRWQPLSGTTTSAARLHNPEKQSAPCSPGPVHSRAEERTPADQSTERNTLHLCFSTTSVFRKQHKVRLVVSLNVKTNKDGNNLSREVSIWVPAGPQRSFVRHYSSSLVPWFL